MPKAASASTIVLVDDDRAVRRALTFAFEVDGFRVEAYSSGEALTAQLSMPGQGCLVIDYNLPGMDGLDLLAHLRARAVTLPAIVITTNPKRDLKRRVAEAGATLVEKPLLGEVLTDRVREALASAA